MLALLYFYFVSFLPSPALTPGVTRPLTKTTICTTKWGKDHRHVTDAMKRHVAHAYGVAWSDRSHYEFDHLIPRELGGADDEKNLWPQSRTGTWTAGQKDRLENRLHGLVCAGVMDLVTAQHAFTTDWTAAYVRYVR